jgi:putative ABC transport system substrate-binding protein
MKRRELLTLLGGTALAWSGAARSEESRPIQRVGILIGVREDDPVYAKVAHPALVEGMKQLGWIEGKDFRFELRASPGGDVEGFRRGAAELVAMRPDAIIGLTPGAAIALRDATTKIPIVFGIVDDPVERGLVASNVRPLGNITGVLDMDPRIGGKWIQFLKQLAPNVSEIALAYNPDAPNLYSKYKTPVDEAATALSIRVFTTFIRSESEIDDVFNALARPNLGLVCGLDAFSAAHRAPIIAAVARNRLPAIYPVRYWPTDGGLMSYGQDQPDMYRQLCIYIDRVLRGVSPADLPVMLPRKFEFVLNLKTAKALDLRVPQSLLVAADTVIE